MSGSKVSRASLRMYSSVFSAKRSSSVPMRRRAASIAASISGAVSTVPEPSSSPSRQISLPSMRSDVALVDAVHEVGADVVDAG